MSKGVIRIADKGEHRIPSASSSDARALRSGKALRDAMMTLLQTQSFEQTSIRDICGAAGVHYATFFRHFPTKEALLDAVAQTEIAQLSEFTFQILKASDYLESCTVLCRYVDEHRSTWATLLNGGAGSAMREEWLRQSKAVAEREGLGESWLPGDLGPICAATLIAETLAWWVGQPAGAQGVDAMAKILYRLLTGSIVTAP